MAKIKVTVWQDFKSNIPGCDQQEFKRGDVISIDEERAVSLHHRQLVIYGDQSQIQEKEEKHAIKTKEEKHAPVSTKNSISTKE